MGKIIFIEVLNKNFLLLWSFQVRSEMLPFIFMSRLSKFTAGFLPAVGGSIRVT